MEIFGSEGERTGGGLRRHCGADLLSWRGAESAYNGCRYVFALQPSQDGELYVLARSRERVAKERSMRRKQWKRLWRGHKPLQAMTLRREDLLMKLGAARQHSPSAWRLVQVEVQKDRPAFTYRLKQGKLRQVRRREGRYLLRSNLTETDPATVWHYYLQLLLERLKLELPAQPPPRITVASARTPTTL